jgi:hypothetical protein
MHVLNVSKAIVAATALALLGTGCGSDKDTLAASAPPDSAVAATWW